MRKTQGFFFTLIDGTPYKNDYGSVFMFKTAEIAREYQPLGATMHRLVLARVGRRPKNAKTNVNPNS